MDKKTILVVDDDREIAQSIGIFLRNEGFDTILAYDGMDALSRLSGNKINLILLDVMMPKLDGIKTIIKIREDNNIPVILVSAKSEDTDKILGLTIGADDYITKPFNPLELIARVKAAIRRSMYTAVEEKNKIVIGSLVFDTENKIVTVDNEEVKLTALEYKILKLLCENPNRIFSAEEIYSKVWNEDIFVNDNTIAVHIRRIREKIEIDPKNPKYLKVVWGIGYKIQKN